MRVGKDLFIDIKMLVYIFLLLILSICILRYEQSVYPFNKELTPDQLKRNSPPVKIQATYFINMDQSVERKEAFIKQFHDTKGPLPLVRFPGVLVTDPKIKNRGDYGCTLAHVQCLKTIALQHLGWYLVCEDDGHGDYGSISTNTAVKEIVSQTSKKFINLSTQLYNGKVEATGHSLSKVLNRATAYLIHSSIAQNLAESVEKTAKTIIVDVKFSSLLREPRLFVRGNGLGAFVGLIKPGKESVRKKINT
jgi:hypothetical protein